MAPTSLARSAGTELMDAYRLDTSAIWYEYDIAQHHLFVAFFIHSNKKSAL